MRKKDFRGRRLLAGLMLLVMVSSVVADCSAATAFAADNKINISESENVLKKEKENYQNDEAPTVANTDSDQNNIPNTTEENDDLENKDVLKEDYQEDSPTEATPETAPETDQDKNPDNTEENNDLEPVNKSEEIKDEDSDTVPEEKSNESKDFNKELVVDGYKVIINAAEGVFPDETKVEVKTVDTIGDEKVQDVISEEVEELEHNAQIVKTVVFDINFYSKDGKIIEPENGSVSITITPDLQETSELQEIEKELGKSLECSVFHVDEELNVEEVESEIKEDYTEVTFEAESFSSYVVTWYAAPDKDGYQEISTEGPKYIGGFERVPFEFSDFTVPIAWGNDNGDPVLRPKNLTFTVYGTDLAKPSEKIKICDITIEGYNGTDSTIDLADAAAIPVYVKKGTGKKESGGTAKYEMDGFKYEVKFHDENTAYKSSNPIAEMKTEREPNDPVWYASAKRTITSDRTDLAKASFKIEWYDNHNENGKRPYYSGETINTEELKKQIALYYYTDADTTPKIVTENMMPAGKDNTKPVISKDSYSTWSISYENLLPADENGNAIKYILKLSDNFAPNYTYDDTENTYINDKGTRKYSLLGEFKANIRWNDGGMEDYLRPESSLKFKVVDGKGTEIKIAPEDIRITDREDNIWKFEVDNLIKYSDEGIVSYYVTLDETVLSNYKVTYTNAPKSTDVTKCHEDGTIFVTLQRSLDSFTIQKKWVDNNNFTDREELIKKGVTLYLWRYPVKKVVNGSVVPGSIEDGAPVNKLNGEQYSYKLTETDSKIDNLKIHFKEFVGENGTLETYDTQGYQYVYYVTEIMGGNEYVTSYSNVNPYTHIETAVADGGTLINLRKESIKIEGIVRWRVPSVTDYTKASATICLQRFDADSKKWIDVGSPVTVAGFTEADPQKKHVFPAVDKYDELGREIKYRVIETNINYNGSDISVDNYNPLESAEKRYVAENYEMNSFVYTATAHSTWPNPSTEAEKYSFTVDNRMSGDVNLDIKKIWKTKEKYGLDGGHYSDITINIIQKDYQGNTTPTPYGTIEVKEVNPLTGELKKAADGNCYATLTIGGKETKILVTAKEDKIKEDETNLVWTFDKIDLPEFDSEGRAFTYSIKEESISNTHASYEYEFDGRDIIATASNSYTTGGTDSIYFEIDKEWVDGADLSQRQPVTVAIVNIDPATGAYSLKDNAGQTHEFVLSAENNWHKEVWLSEHYDNNGTPDFRFNKDSEGNWLWTVIEEDVTLKAEYEKLDGLDLSADDKMDIIHRKVTGYPMNLSSNGLSATSIEGKVAAIVHNDIYKPGYEVKIEEAGGNSVFGASKYKITNKRAGEVNITFNKTWHDSKNKANTRGNAFRVKLYQDGKQVVSNPEEADVDHVYIPGVTSPAEQTYTYSVSGNGLNDIFHFNNLPKYDDYGVAYQYSVREFMVRGTSPEEEIEILTYDTEDTTLSGYVADIEGHEAAVTFDKSAEKLIRNEEYKYHNTLTGKLTTGVPFYVIWHDQSSYDDGGRPDMYFTLYYRTIGSDEAPKKFEGDYKVIWEADKETVGGAIQSNPYYKKATFIDLPAADEAGNAYEFFAAPSLNNAADHYYERYFIKNDEVKRQDGSNGTETVVANNSTGIHHYDIRKGGTDDVDKPGIIKLDGGNIKLIPAGGLIEYIIHEEITPKGKKTWKNVEQGITKENLPNVKIYLGRYSDHDKSNQMYESVPVVVSANSIDNTTLDTDKLSYDFETLADGSENPNAPYAKYDYYGQIYTYQLAEQIFANSSGSYELPDYIMKYDPLSLNLVNTYLGGVDSSRSITVTKKWADNAGPLSITGQYPEARFKLYRMEIDPVECRSDGLSAGTIPYNPGSSKYEGVVDLNGFTECSDEKIIKYNPDTTTQTASWNDLPIYAPSGRPYFYAVKEIDAHGMESYTITNNAISSADGSDRNNRWISDQLVLISNSDLNPSGKYSDNPNNRQDVEFTNTLKNTDIINKITGKKVWTDSPYSTDVRPEPEDCNTFNTDDTRNGNQQIKLVLKRSAKSQTDANNAVSTTLEEGVDYKVIWSETASTNEWKYEIVPINSNEFQVYAPNGKPYTYTVTEKLEGVAAENYKATTSSASKSADLFTTVGTENVLNENTSLKNTLKGQIQLFKKWDDALNEYKLRSGYVDVILQYREVGIGDKEGTNASEGWKTYKQNGSDDSVYRLSYDSGKWKKSVSNLPIKNADGSKVYEYRVLEIDFKDHEGLSLVPITYVASSGGTESTVSYKPDKASATESPVPNGYDSDPKYNNSTRFPGTGHFETRAGNYIVNHSEIVNLIKENTRMLQVENFLSEKASLTVEKKWDGIKGNDEYEVLPDQIVFKVQYTTNKDSESSWKDLYEQGTKNIVTVTVYKKDDWKQTAELPQNTTDGKIIYYRAIELGTNLGRFEGYTGEGKPVTIQSSKPGVVYEHYAVHNSGQSGSDFGSTECSTIATNTLATRNLTVRKKWNDDENAVHGDVDIQLWSSNYNTGIDGSETFEFVNGTNATLKASENYEFTYHNLPLRNKDGKNIVYYIKEVNVDGATYDKDNYDTAFFVTTNNLNYSQASANGDACNIASIDKNGGIAKSVCIVNTPKATLSVTKKWNDENNRHRQRKNVIFKLTDDNGGSWTSITSDTTDRTYYFEKLPIYKAPKPAFVINDTMANMGKVTYTVTEDNSVISVNGYNNPVYTVNGEVKTEASGKITLNNEPSVSENSVHILNEKNPPKAIITADKLWVDENNRHGSRTSQIELSLYYRVGSSGNWKIVTNRQLDEDGNYSDGGIYTTSDVTQALSQSEADSSDSNKWLHNNTFAIWKDLPTYKDGQIVNYKIFETKGTAASTHSSANTDEFSGYKVTYSDVNGSSFKNNGETKNQTVTNTLKRTEILVEKVWEDTIEQKIRPYSVTFEIEYKHANKPWKLYTENDQAKRIIVTGEHTAKKWTQIVKDLPFADSEGHEYEYRLKEVSMQIKTSSGVVDVYDQSSDENNFTETKWNGEIGTYDNEITVIKSSGTSYNYIATAVNTPDVGSITVTKVWDDNNNRDGIRPETIEVTLYRDGKEYAEAEIGLNHAGSPLSGTTVNGNKWTYTWNNLPMYKDDAGVHDATHMSAYYVVEDSISDDEVHNYKKPTYGLLEDSITSINATHIQSHVSDDASTTDLWIKNTHDPIRFKIDAYKKWDDSNADHTPDHRPDKIKLELQYRIHGSGSTTWNTVTPNVSANDLNKEATTVGTTSDNPQIVTGSDDIWTVPSGWDNLPAYFIDTTDTKLIEYRIKEEWFDADKKKHYDSELPLFHYDIEEAKLEGENYPKDHLIVENIADYNSTLTVTKKWDEKELIEKYGALPSELHVRLQNWDTEKGTWVNTKIGEVEQTAILKEHEDSAFENSWTHTFQWLTEGYTYRVIEEKIVFKKDGKSFEIKSSGITNNITDLGDGNGQGTIGNFKIEASIRELEHEGAVNASASKHWVVELKNSLANRKIQVVKNWNDEENRDELRPTHVYMTLQRDGKNIETVMLHDTNSWTHVWDYLPLYKDGSTEKSVYRVIETDEHGNPVSLNGYEVSYAMKKPDPGIKLNIIGDFDLGGVENGEQVELTITNTHKPVKSIVYAGKKWDDKNNKYGERADTIYLALFYKYQHEPDSEWRLIEKNAFDSECKQYTDADIYTTSDPVQIVENQSSVDEYWKDVAKWENLPSQALVANVARIPEYRVVEVNSLLSDVGTDKLSDIVTAMGGNIAEVISGYKTTHPDAFFVSENGGVSTNHIVINELETVSALIIKKWDDQNNRFANRPVRIDFAIQKKEGSGKWELLKEEIDGKSVDKIVSVYPEMLGDNDNEWKLSVDGLPKCAASGAVLKYRAVEISLVYADKTVPVFDKDVISEDLNKTTIDNSGYKTVEVVNPSVYHEADDRTEYPTTITNIQDKSAKVSAKKVWNDNNNGRKKRPLSIIFKIEMRPVHDGSTVLGMLSVIKDFFMENNGWVPVYELNGAGEKVVATITLDGPDFEEVSLKGLPLYDENGNELVYRAREIQLVYENKIVDIATGANPYSAPKYVDDAVVTAPDTDGITHSYTTEATNKIKPVPQEEEPEPDNNPLPPQVIPPKDPTKPELPPELKEIDEEIEDIKDPEDIIPIVEELLDLPDGPEKDPVIKKLWEIVKIMADDPTFYDHFDPEMQDILRRFVKTGVLGRRRGLPKTGGLKGSFLLLLLGFTLIIIGTRFIRRCDNRE